jgi:GNAT superfamily N-acetyltransferase
MPEKNLTGFSVRPGNVEDLPLAKEICADIYGGNDYIPYVWDEWNANPQNRPFIVESDEGAAGLYILRLDFAGASTGWLQGVRVKAAFRNQGVGRFIMEQAANQSRELGLHTLQFATARDNYAMHRLAGLFGFWHVGNFLNFNFERSKLPPHSNILESRLVTTSEFDEAYRLILDSDEYRLGHGIYCVAWNWKHLSMDVFRKHLERREVYCLVGALKVLAILRRTEDGESWLAFLAGEKSARVPLLLELARRVSKNIAPGEPFQYTAQVVQTPANETLLQQAGFKPDGHEPGLLLYELDLEEPAP